MNAVLVQAGEVRRSTKAAKKTNLCKPFIEFIVVAKSLKNS